MRTFNYFLIVLGMGVIFQMAGFGVANTAFGIVGYTPGDGFNFSILKAAVLLILGLAAVAGLAATLTARSPTENFIIVPFAGSALVTVLTIAIAIINSAPNTWTKLVATVVVGIPTIGFIISLLEWFRGTD